MSVVIRIEIISKEWHFFPSVILFAFNYGSFQKFGIIESKKSVNEGEKMTNAKRQRSWLLTGISVVALSGLVICGLFIVQERWKLATQVEQLMMQKEGLEAEIVELESEIAYFQQFVE